MSEEQIMTEVTSVAQEEARTGQEVMPAMTDMQLVNYAAQNLTADLAILARTFKGMKAKFITQAVIAGLDFPKEGLPVTWVDKTGKPRQGYENVIQAFMLMQRLFSSKFVLTQKYVLDEAKRLKTSNVSSQNPDKVSEGNNESLKETTNE